MAFWHRAAINHPMIQGQPIADTAARLPAEVSASPIEGGARTAPAESFDPEQRRTRRMLATLIVMVLSLTVLAAGLAS